MNEYGFIKISAAVPKLKILDTEYNVKEIITAVDKAKEDGSSIVVTPELSLCANTAGDLIYSDSCRHGCNLAISALKEYSNSFAKDIAIVVGTPVYTADRIYKSALVILNGKIMGVVPTEQYCIQTLPSYVDILNEKVPFGKLLFEFDKGVIAGIVGEEDLYTPVSESYLMALRGANLILNVGSGRELSERNSHRETAIKVQSSKSICAYVYVGSGVYESTTDTVCYIHLRERRSFRKRRTICKKNFRNKCVY